MLGDDFAIFSDHGLFTNIWIISENHILGVMKDEPKETTLSSFQAMLATALMKGTPSYEFLENICKMVTVEALHDIA